MVKQFMNDMSGEIDLISDHQQGTMFYCTIPVQLPLTNDFIPEYNESV